MAGNLFDTEFIDENGARIKDPSGIVLNSKLRAVNGAFKDNLAANARTAAKKAENVLRQGIVARTDKSRSTGELIRSVKFRETKYTPGGGPYTFLSVQSNQIVERVREGSAQPRLREFTGGGYYQASVTVGEGVPHAGYWFKGTGKFRKELVGNTIVPAIYQPPGRIYAKDTTAWAAQNPEKSNQAYFKYKAGGITYKTYSFAGQKDNLDLIKKSRAASNAVLNQAIKNVARSIDDNKVKLPFPTFRGS
jgi:hypothetical protein